LLEGVKSPSSVNVERFPPIFAPNLIPKPLNVSSSCANELLNVNTAIAIKNNNFL
tara:strand:- start:293 stop:457 length:165 start_codon:yes stop_codon:yes gene_type:complete